METDRRQTFNLSALPDDVLLRIISHSGDTPVQLGFSYRLGAVSSRFRALLTSQVLPSITHITPSTLSALSLRNATAASSALTSFFSGTTSVRQLNLAGCSPAVLSRDAIAALATAGGLTLSAVNLSHCRLSDDDLSPLLQCRGLRALSLVSCVGPTGGCFHGSVCVAPLATLDVSWVRTISEQGVLAISTLRTLKTLLFTGCDVVTTRLLERFAASLVCQSLVSISLSYCPVRDHALYELVRRAPHLRTLTLAEFTCNLWSTGEFTQGGVQRIQSAFPNVDVRFLA